MAPKKVAPAPAAIRKAAAPAAPTNPLYEKRPRSFSIGGDIAPKKDMHRFVKWPKYVRIQRQRRVLTQRLKVPPALNRFTRTLDKSTAETLFKLLMKYRPEDKAAKKERLLKEAEARAAGQEVEKKKPLVVKYGINHITTLVEQGKAQLVVISHDVDPIELVIWLPALCKKMNVPYVIVKGKARLGTVVHKKTATALAITGVKADDQRELAKVVDTAKSMYLEGARVHWGGGIMGPKSQEKTKKRERALAKELGGRPIYRIGLYRVTGSQVIARSDSEPLGYTQFSSSTQTSAIARIASRVLIFIPITAAILGISPRKVSAATATANLSAINGNHEASVMDHRTGMPRKWGWNPTTFTSSATSSCTPQWSWNPTNFPSSPRVALIAAGLIGCAYILGVAWKQVKTTTDTTTTASLNSSEDSTEGALDTVAATRSEDGSMIGIGGASDVEDDSENGTVMTGYSSSIYDKSISLGPSSNLFDGPGLSGAGAVSSAAGVVGRSREELIVESQRRINAAKEALEKVEQQKTEAKVAAESATEAVAEQEEEMSAAVAVAQVSHIATNINQSRNEKSIADSFDMVRSIVHSAALVQDWGTPLTTKYDPLQNTIGNIMTSQSQWEISDWAGPNKYCPVTDILQGVSSAPPPSRVASKYDPFCTFIKNIGTSSWTGPARDRTKAPLREEKYDMIAALFSAIMLQKDPPLRKDQNKDEISWDPVAVALDGAAGWQPPQPRSFNRASTTSPTINIGEQDKYDLTASLMAGLYTITPPRMADGGAQWDPVKYLLSGWAGEWEGTAVDFSKPVSPAYDPAAAIKGAEASRVRSKYDWAQASGTSK